VILLSFALLGAAVGAGGGFWLGIDTQIHSAEVDLDNYATNLIRHADEYQQELVAVRNAFNPSPYPFCSAKEIGLMQALTFRSLQLKEVGRTRDDKLYCSAFLGVLNPPPPLPPATMQMPGGMRIFANIPLQFADFTRGTILEDAGVDVVLSPNAFDHWEEQSLRYMVVLVHPQTHTQVQLGGSRLPVPQGWFSSPGFEQTDSDLYMTKCSTRGPICVVTSETRQQALSDHRALIEYFSMGAIAGFCFGLAIGQFYRQQTGLSRQFRRALRRDHLRLVYQPILELPSRAFAGAEALARWSDEEGRPISPEVFVRIAEERGLIGELTSFVIRCAVAELGDLLRRHPELTLSVNIAASDLEREAFFELLEMHVRHQGIAPRQLALELTERSTADVSKLQQAILRLHMEGYQVHIDDFGTGFSSLAYLHELAVDAIKIDRTFTRTIGTDAVTVSILPQILALAESLHVGVIVEGVETEEQAAWLTATGKTMQAQGWYFGKPVSAADLIRQGEQRAITATAEQNHGAALR
jgi:sensor c-di-GMP phosphodiesterase-like protein